MRANSSLKAEILVDDATPIPCIVRNVSIFGAKIDTASASTIPDSFHLRAPELNLSKQAKIVWRTATEVGVKFQRPSTVGTQFVS